MTTNEETIREAADLLLVGGWADDPTYALGIVRTLSKHNLLRQEMTGEPTSDLEVGAAAPSPVGMTNERLAELEEWAELGLLTRNNTRELVAEIRRERQEVARLLDAYGQHTAQIENAEDQRDEARAQVARLEEELVGVRSTVDRVQRLCEAQGADSYVMVYAPRHALAGGA